MRFRRSRRQAWPVAILAAAALAGCGAETGDSSTRDQTADPTAGTIVVTTNSGDTFEFTDFELKCVVPKSGRRARVVVASSGRGTKPAEPILWVSAVDKLANTEVTLPYDEVVGREKTHISVFSPQVGDVDHLSAGAEESSGSVDVISASCEPTPSIEVRIDGTLYSEYNEGGHATVRGSLRAGESG